MKNSLYCRMILMPRISIVAFILVLVSLFLFSFAIEKI